MKKFFLPFMLAVVLMLTGCSGNSVATNDAAKSESTEASTKSQLVLPATENKTGKVTIQTVSGSTVYPYNSYIITSESGESIVVDPTEMPAKSIVDIKPAAIISTHGHPDHTDEVFSGSYADSQKLASKTGEIKTKDFHIYSVASSHSGDTIPATGHAIMVIEVNGLRIAHFGDTGQTAFTDEQLKAVGKIDIAFMQFENTYSDMSLENEKGFKLLEQINPAIVIPTHYTDKALPVLEKKYGKINEVSNLLTISKADLPANTKNVYRILNEHKYK